jgi:hypothetical protein
MAKRLTVLDFTSAIGVGSDKVPVTVRRGLDTIATYRSLYEMPKVASVDVLESKISFVEVKHEGIIIRIK